MKSGRYHLVKSGDPGFAGLFASRDSFAIGKGQFKRADNVRVTDKAVQARAGCTAVTNAGAPAAGGTLRGLYLHERPGDTSASSYAELYMALEVSGKTRVYFNQYSGNFSGVGGTWGGWVECTAASGKYGDSRRVSPVGYGRFASVPRYDSFDVVFQSGKDDPIVFDATASGTACPVKEVPSPTWAEKTAPSFGPAATASLTDVGNANVTYTPTGPTFGPVGANSWDIPVATAGTGGDTLVVYQTNSSVSMSNSGQAWLLMSFPDESFLRCCKFEAVSSAGAVGGVLNDPADSDQTYAVPTGSVDVDGRQVYLVALSGTVTAANLAGFKATVTAGGAGKLTTGTVRVVGIMAGGKVPGFAQYSVAYRCAGSRSESKGVHMRTGHIADDLVQKTVTTVMPYAWVIGAAPIVGVSSATVRTVALKTPGRFEIPMDVGLHYAVKLKLTSFLATTTDPVDYIDVYRRDPDEQEFYRLAQIQSAEYTAGAWANYTGSVAFSALGGTGTLTDTSPNDALDKEFTEPSAFNEELPRGLGMCVAGSRLHVGVAATSSKDGGRVLASDRGYPHRFRRVSPADDPDAGYETEVGEGEDVTCVVPSPGQSSLQGGSVMAFTSQGVYRMAGGQSVKTSGAGTLSPFSVSDRGGAVFYVDSEGVHRRVGLRMTDLSTGTVDGLVAAVPEPNRHRICALVTKDRCLTVLPTTTGTASFGAKTLCYLERLGAYESLDTYKALAPVPAMMVSHRQAGKTMFATMSGAMYTYEDGATDDGSDIEVRLQPGTLWSDDDGKVGVGVGTVLVTDQAGKTVTLTRTDAATGSASASSWVLPGTALLAWKTDPSQSKGIYGPGVDVLLSADVSYPFVVKAAGVEVVVGAGSGAGA